MSSEVRDLPVLVIVNVVTGAIRHITADPSDARVTSNYAYQETKQRHETYPGLLSYNAVPWDDRA